MTGTQEFATSSNHFCWTTKLQVGLVVAIFKVTLGSLYKNYQYNIDTFLTFILRVFFSCLFIFPKRIFPFLLVWEIYFRCIFSFHNLTLWFFFCGNITFHIFQNILFSVNCLPLTIVEMFHLSVSKLFTLFSTEVCCVKKVFGSSDVHVSGVEDLWLWIH